jgi:hypothetical protein
MTAPFRIAVRGECVASIEQLHENARKNAHHPKIERRRLAVVGGGPLVVDHLDELREWKGDIWAINRTAQWLKEQGIRATLFTIDPTYMQIDCEDRLLASACHPDMFTGNCQAFDLIETHADGFAGGQSSATRAPHVALKLGYTHVAFFGCEGSFSRATHIDRDEAPPHQMIIRAGGADYRVTPDMLLQCEELSTLIRTFDGVFHCRSGGLLQAMIDHPDTWEVVGVSAALKEHLEQLNGHHGLYESAYVPVGEAA